MKTDENNGKPGKHVRAMKIIEKKWKTNKTYSNPKKPQKPNETKKNQRTQRTAMKINKKLQEPTEKDHGKQWNVSTQQKYVHGTI